MPITLRAVTHLGALLFGLVVLVSASYAGGPLVVQSNGVPYKWSTASALPYSLDGGSLGLWNNATANANVLQAFNRWGPDLSTSALTFASAGAIPGDGDVNTTGEFFALDSGCDGISPVIYDATGSLFAALGMPSSLIGFAGPACAVGGTITESLAAFNGKWFDGNPTNGELTEAEFKGLLVHEFGHWLNLDHSQTNGHYFFSGETDPGFAAFGPPPLASVEIMFPFAIGGSTIPVKDDIVAVSRMYPAAGFSSTTGSITGTIRYANGVTPFQGANVIARNVADPYYDAVSNVSGRPYGAPSSVGAYELPGLTDAASYAVEMVNVRSNFTAGSGVGPLDPPAVIPAPEEFYNGVNEAATNPPDDVSVYTAAFSSGGVVASGTDIIMNGPSANLSLTKSDSPDPAIAGQNVTYTVTVTNNGPSTATGVTVTDTLPPGVTFVSATPSQGTCSQASGTVTCGIGTMGNGVTRTVTIVVTTTASGTITNTASVIANENDPSTGNNSASATTTVNPGADLVVSQSDSPDPVSVGGSVTYTVTVTNNGPSPATAVVLTNTLPTGVTFNSATPSQGTCNAPSGGAFTCGLGTLAASASATVSVVVTTSTDGVIANVASATAAEGDLNTGNNTSSEPTYVGSVSLLTNISTRAFVGTGSNVAVGGFIISGTGSKQVLIRGFGPTLSSFGISGALPNPILELFWDDDSNPSTPAILVVSNNDWGTPLGSCPSPIIACGTPQGILNTGLSADTYAPTNANRHLDAALLLTLPAGTYTARLSGVSGGTGVGLIGVDDTDPSQSATLINISTRAFVGTGANVEVGGFIISGTANKQLLLRGFGPTLTSFGISGALANPQLDLYWDDDSNPSTPAILVVGNNDWGTALGSCPSPIVACGTPQDIINTGLSADSYAPTNSNRNLDSALLLTLPPGTYTARLSGVSAGTGVGLIGVDQIGP